MRLEDDETYPEMKETIAKFFNAMDESDTAEDITDWISEDLNWWLQGTSGKLRMLAVGVIEIQRGILEERVRSALSAIIYRYEQGVYNRDITKEDNEDKVIKEDIEFVKRSMQLVPAKKLVTVIYDNDGNEVGTKPFEV